MDQFKRINHGSFRSIFSDLDDQLQMMKFAAESHFGRWLDIAKEYQQEFELASPGTLGGTGSILGKSYSISAEFCLTGAEVTAEILITGTDSITNDRVLIDSYYLGQSRQILSKANRSQLIHKSDLMASEHQAICEALFSVAEQERIK